MRRRVLVLGGTGYFGKHLVKMLLANGDDVTIATRGVNQLPAGCTFINYDRNSDVSLAVEGCFDVVYDQSCYSSKCISGVENIVRTSSKYFLTSSQAVYLPGINISEHSIDYNNIEYYRDKLSLYGFEKLKSEKLVIEFNKRCVLVRFPVVVGINDPRGRIQSIVQKISNEFITLPMSNPILQLIDECDAARALFELGIKDYTGAINIATNKPVSVKYLCESIAKELDVSLDANWVHDYEASGFDLIKNESKTLLLDKQNQLGLSVKSVDEVLRSILTEICGQNIT